MFLVVFRTHNSDKHGRLSDSLTAFNNIFSITRRGFQENTCASAHVQYPRKVVGMPDGQLYSDYSGSTPLANSAANVRKMRELRLARRKPLIFPLHKFANWPLAPVITPGSLCGGNFLAYSEVLSDPNE
jgi:hypothetical protein